MAPPTSKRKHFVAWDEEYVSNDRGSRVVHYYLKDRYGNSKLAVVGTERSLRHMVYVVSDEFLHLLSNNKSVSSTPYSSVSSSSMKWRSRREVVDWLSSLLSRPPRTSTSARDHNAKLQMYNSPSLSETDISYDEEIVQCTDGFRTSKDRLQNKSRISKEVLWIGTPWTCRKHLTHYKSFCRNGINISVHDFVYILAEGRERHIAYLEDMFEDTKARKLVRVQWFHKTNEVLENIPPPSAPHSKELFFASLSQVLNVECVDGLATVLIPEHYRECLTKLPSAEAVELQMCYRQFDNDVIKPFDISQLEGYWHQGALSYIDLCMPRCSPKHELTSDSLDADEEHDTVRSMTIRKGPRKSRSSKRRYVAPNQDRQVSKGTASDSPDRSLVCIEADTDRGKKNKADLQGQVSLSFEIGDRVELLSQDSGIRGCWFRCVVVSKEQQQLKVRYEDVLNEDESDKLEEWVPASKAVTPDNLGIRAPGRLTVRPFPPEIQSFGNIEIGIAVDAWWNDGWWEGLVVMIEDPLTKVHVYLPGEKETQIFQIRDLRISRDWVNYQWISLKEVPSLAATLVSFDKKDECLEPATFSRGCRTSSAVDESSGLVGCTDKNLSPVSSFAVRESSDSDVETDNADEKNLEVKTEFGVDLVKNNNRKLVSNRSNYGLLGDLKWKTSRKRSRDSAGLQRASPSGVKYSRRLGNKVMDAGGLKNKEGLSPTNNKKDLARRLKSSELLNTKRLREAHENLKPINGCPLRSPLFTSPMPLSNLVMSR